MGQSPRVYENVRAKTSNVVNIEVPHGKPIEEVYDGAHYGCMLGLGVTDAVRKVTHSFCGTNAEKQNGYSA